jgi:hypothetical protein
LAGVGGFGSGGARRNKIDGPPDHELAGGPRSTDRGSVSLQLSRAEAGGAEPARWPTLLRWKQGFFVDVDVVVPPHPASQPASHGSAAAHAAAGQQCTPSIYPFRYACLNSIGSDRSIATSPRSARASLLLLVERVPMNDTSKLQLHVRQSQRQALAGISLLGRPRTTRHGRCMVSLQPRRAALNHKSTNPPRAAPASRFQRDATGSHATFFFCSPPSYGAGCPAQSRHAKRQRPDASAQHVSDSDRQLQRNSLDDGDC